MSIMDEIRAQQANSVHPERTKPPPHEPEMLYIGCVDARLDPIDDIGIGKGAALIFRNIGALVMKDEGTKGGAFDPKAFTASRELPQNVGVGAVLEFFLNHMPHRPGRIKHIVVSGHTDCGGMRACQDEVYGEGDPHLSLYLGSLSEVRGQVRAQAKEQGWSKARLMQALEEESVRLSMRNLKSYAAVEKALAEGRVELHGWVINTATQQIREMNPETLVFEPMSER